MNTIPAVMDPPDRTRYLPFVGRLLIGGLLAVGGLAKIGTYGEVVGLITAAGLPLAPLGAAIAIVVEIGCGLLLVLGYRVRVVALLLAAWCVVTAVFFHRDFADLNSLAHFLKNIMITGGLLQIAHFGAGALGLDTRRTRV